MALLKKVTRGKVIGEYWLITASTWNKKTNKTSVVIDCYKNAQDRIDNFGKPLFPVLMFFIGNLSIEELYVLIKGTKDFKDAVDC